MRLHLLDATYELFRSHFAAPSLTAPDGREVGAIRLLIGTVLVLLREEGVTHIAAATDTVIRSFRNDLFPGYKTEAGVEPNLLAQFPLAERTLRALGVTVWPMTEFEADDAIASAALRFRDEAEQVVLLSPDKDLAQCVTGTRVVMHDRRQKLTIDEPGVLAKWGVPPSAIPDYLALVGDAADGIPGLPGWGPKSAATLLTRYGTLGAIPADAAAWDVPVRGAARLAATLHERRADALLYRELATLRLDVPITETLADLEWHGVRRNEYVALCTELGMQGLASRPHRWAEA